MRQHRLGPCSVSAERPIDDLSGPGLCSFPRARPGPVSDRPVSDWPVLGWPVSQRADQCLAQQGRITPDHASSAVLRVRPGPCRADHHRRNVTQVGVHHLGRPPIPETQRHIGTMAGSKPGGPQDGVRCRDHHPSPTTETRTRFGQHRPRQRLGKSQDGIRWTTSGPSDDDPAHPGGHARLGDQVDNQVAIRRRRAGIHLVPRDTAGPSFGNATSVRVSQEGLPEREVEMHWAGSLRPGHRLGHRSGPDRAPRGPCSFVGHARIDEPPHRSSIQVRLVDGLRGTHVAQFRRAVGRAYEHRHTGQIGFDHCGMELDGRRAARDHDHGGQARGQCDPEGREAS